MKRPVIALMICVTVTTLTATTIGIGHGDHDVEVPKTITADLVANIAIIGDSVAHGAGDESGRGITGWLQRTVHVRNVVNLAVNGARTSTVDTLLKQASVQNILAGVDVMVISVGGNDLYGDRIAQLWSTLSPGSHQVFVVDKIEALVSKLRQLNPSAQIYVLGLYNPYRASKRSRWLDTQVNLWDAQLIAALAAKRNVTVVRIADLLRTSERISTIDHFHPSAYGYEAIANRLVESMPLEGRHLTLDCSWQRPALVRG